MTNEDEMIAAVAAAAYEANQEFWRATHGGRTIPWAEAVEIDVSQWAEIARAVVSTMRRTPSREVLRSARETWAEAMRRYRASDYYTVDVEAALADVFERYRQAVVREEREACAKAVPCLDCGSTGVVDIGDEMENCGACRGTGIDARAAEAIRKRGEP